jgi:hypothetical protein
MSFCRDIKSNVSICVVAATTVDGACAGEIIEAITHRSGPATASAKILGFVLSILASLAAAGVHPRGLVWSNVKSRTMVNHENINELQISHIFEITVSYGIG